MNPETVAYVDFAAEDVQAWYEQANTFFTTISEEIEKLVSAICGEDEPS